MVVELRRQMGVQIRYARDSGREAAHLQRGQGPPRGGASVNVYTLVSWWVERCMG